MKKLITVLTLSFIFAGTANAQPGAKSVFGEIGGNGLFFSGNFDMRFKGEKGIGFRAGLGLFAAEGVSVITFPFGLNHLIGNAPHYLELGFGVTPVTASVDFFGDDTETGSTIFILPTAGYRYAKAGKGFQGRIYVGPVIVEGAFFFPWGGVSVGYKF